MVKRYPFKDWVGSSKKSTAKMLPLTHITIGRFARDILLDGIVEPRYCDVQKKKLVYCFYGRAAYRLSGNDVVRMEAKLPICLVFTETLFENARDVFALDTGALEKSLYKNYLGKEFSIDDFSLNGSSDLPNTLIEKIYPSVKDYIKGGGQNLVNPDDVANKGEFEVQGYLHLIGARGSNQTDDRAGTIEVTFSDPISIKENLICLIAPHTLTKGKGAADWIKNLSKNISIQPYEFDPGRPLEHYHAGVEKAFRKFCKKAGYY